MEYRGLGLTREPVTEDDLLTQLRRQVTQATNEKEEAKIEFEALRRTLDSYLLRLNGALSSPDVNMDRVGGMIQAFDADLKGRLDTGDPQSLRDGVPAEGTYDVLRQSLNSTQHRCQELNGDMLRVADANEELMGTMKTLKGTNKRLVEEVQKQTTELSSLTQQRLLDAENQARLEESFKHEVSMWQQEAKRCIEDEQRRCDEEFENMKATYTSQLDECWRQAKSLGAKAAQLKMLQSQLKTDVQGYSQNVGMKLKEVERSLLEKVNTTMKRMQSEHNNLKDTEHNLQVRVRAEREVRENEADSWQARHKTAAKELEDLQGQRSREIGDIHARTEAVYAARDEHNAVVDTDRAKLHEQVEGHVKESSMYEAMLQTARRKHLQLESRAAQADGERERLKNIVETLRQQYRESDEALAEAVRSNEALREQMEVQRLDAHSSNERDLKLCREMYERRIDLSTQAQQNEQADIHKRIRGAEEGLGMKAGELHAARGHLAKKTRERDLLQRDVAIWKAHHELSHKVKTDVERELTQFRQEALNGELSRLQEHHDEVASRKAELDMSRSQLHADLQQVQQTTAARAAIDADQARAIAGMQTESSAELDHLRTQTSAAEVAIAKAKSEAAMTSQQLSEKQDVMEQELGRMKVEHETTIREHERKVQEERQNCQTLRGGVEKLLAEHATSYRAAFEGPVQQLSVLEGTISDIQRSSDAELMSLRQKSEKLRLRIEELESDVARSQAKLEQTEHEVQDSTARVNVSKVHHRASREALEREKNMKHDETQHILRSIATKKDQLRNLTRTGEDARKRMLHDVEEAKTAKVRQQAESNPRVTHFSDYSRPSSFPMEPLANTAAIPVEPIASPGGYLTTPGSSSKSTREKLDGLFRETDRLRYLSSGTQS
jgi:chromosome segregation ATPase